MDSSVLLKVYDPSKVEKHWGEEWIEQDLFHASPDSDKPPYSIVIPPPNVTGSLHMGHALNITLQDILIRWKKMSGHNILWLPGTDHAGIATQNVVERLIAEEGHTREGMGREKFLERVWQWKEESGGKIINQIKRLGAACDWSRERFTMDEGLSRAVRHAFVSLYKKGLIYRGDYMINWCPRCHTALSDLEVEFETLHAKLYYMRYPGTNGVDVIVATTRPETMLGDTAVAVNPRDDRFIDKVGAAVRLPLTERVIPIISDPMVDPEFGTGAVKITPAHDFNDFQVGRDKELDFIRVIDEHGNMSEDAGPKYRGLERFACRKRVVRDLEEEGLLVKIEDYTHNVGHCYRCKTVIEPNLSLQWFVEVKPLADKAVKAVEEGKTNIIPSIWENTYFDWMNKIKDWCISRQIWWGHRIPAWYCHECQEITVEYEDPDECQHCGSGKIVQEVDVLDTWFSSALWPFSTLGWPEDSRDLNVYYPTSVLVTGFDILFFWVARMMMMGLEFKGDVPFRDVFIHALVRDAEGQKMSKTRGNVIDPLEVMDVYGTDSFRFTLTALAAQGRDIKMSEERIEGYRNFINKLWNSARFVIMNLDGFNEKDITPERLEDRWILARLEKTKKEVWRAFSEYKFNEGASALYRFLWHEYCDWYIELSKPFLAGTMGEKGKSVKQNILLHILQTLLKMLHPVIPFVTEEIWHAVPGDRGFLIHESWPESSVSRFDDDSESSMYDIFEVIRAIRNLRREFLVPPGMMVDTRIKGDGLETLRQMEWAVKLLARVNTVDYIGSGVAPDNEATAVVGDKVICLPVKDILDPEKERIRIGGKIKKVEGEIEMLERKLSREDFVKRAPAELVDNTRTRKEELVNTLDRLKDNLRLFQV